MLLIVGLGNPGAKYNGTRHNIGFEVVDFILKKHGDPRLKEAHHSLIYKISVDKRACIFAKPMTFMNNSGEAVLSLVNYYKISLDNLLVIHDDVDQKFGAVKFQSDRGSGGHNGVQDISEKLNNQGYNRLKVGIGKSENTHDHVLGKFHLEELDSLKELLSYSSEMVEAFIKDGFKTAVQYNRKGFNNKRDIDRKDVDRKDVDRKDIK